MKTFEFNQTQTINRALDDAFAFFADPRNLERITPPWLDFRIVTEGDIQMANGTLIDYALKIRGFPIKWQSKISYWEPPHCFIDEQMQGPYRQWIHTHTFTAHERGTRVTDTIHYAVPGGMMIERLFVGPDIRKIFAYRLGKIRELLDSD